MSFREGNCHPYLVRPICDIRPTGGQGKGCPIQGQRNLCVEPEEVAETPNKYFVLVFTKEKELVEDDLREGSVEFLSQIAIKVEEVLCALKSIKVVKSPGPDEIYPRILRDATEQIAGALTDIFESLLATGEVLEDWRIANVVPLFKKGNRDNAGNYRP
eukprot:g38638.t1